MERVLRLTVILMVVAMSAFFGCTAVYTERNSDFDISGIVAEEKENGFVVKIETAKEIGGVEAWIGADNWLYISIPDTDVDLTKFDELKKNHLIEEAEFFHYPGSVQVTLRLKEKMDHLEVLHYPDDRNVYVVLYQFKSES